MENKMTSIEWLIEQLKSRYDIDIERLTVTDQSKAMEKDQIINAYSNGWHDGQDIIINRIKHIEKGGDEAGNNHYNETYGTER